MKKFNLFLMLNNNKGLWTEGNCLHLLTGKWPVLQFTVSDSLTFLTEDEAKQTVATQELWYSDREEALQLWGISLLSRKREPKILITTQSSFNITDWRTFPVWLTRKRYFTWNHVWQREDEAQRRNSANRACRYSMPLHQRSYCTKSFPTQGVHYLCHRCNPAFCFGTGLS